MPHLIVEYSANLDGRIQIDELLRKVHEAALASGIFQIGAVRTRAERRDQYIVADGNPENSFVTIWARIAPGRDAESRRRFGKAVFDAVCNHLQEVYETSPLSISLEVQEIDTTAVFRKNNLHEIVKQRAASKPSRPEAGNESDGRR
jgi:5-carboxymethyl-2-hydroxymuconate isomerase